MNNSLYSAEQTQKKFNFDTASGFTSCYNYNPCLNFKETHPAVFTDQGDSYEEMMKIKHQAREKWLMLNLVKSLREEDAKNKKLFFASN